MNKFVITIGRSYGSGGRTLGKMLAEELGVKYYDRELLRLASDASGINDSLFGQVDEKIKNSSLFRITKSIYKGEIIPPESDDFVSDDNLFNYQAKILKEMALSDSYVVIGRAADFILQDNPNMISIFLHAEKEISVRHIMEEKNFTEKQAEKYRKKMDRYRSQYYKYHTGKVWRCPDNYDLCLDTGKLGYEDCVKLIMEYVAMRIQ